MRFTQVLETYAERQKPVDIGHLMVVLTMDFILASMFGMDCRTLEVFTKFSQLCNAGRGAVFDLVSDGGESQHFVRGGAGGADTSESVGQRILHNIDVGLRECTGFIVLSPGSAHPRPSLT